jgi:hypothetical protein
MTTQCECRRSSLSIFLGEVCKVDKFLCLYLLHVSKSTTGEGESRLVPRLEAVLRTRGTKKTFAYCVLEWPPTKFSPWTAFPVPIGPHGVSFFFVGNTNPYTYKRAHFTHFRSEDGGNNCLRNVSNTNHIQKNWININSLPPWKDGTSNIMKFCIMKWNAYKNKYMPNFYIFKKRF